MWVHEGKDAYTNQGMQEAIHKTRKACEEKEVEGEVTRNGQGILGRN